MVPETPSPVRTGEGGHPQGDGVRAVPLCRQRRQHTGVSFGAEQHTHPLQLQFPGEAGTGVDVFELTIGRYDGLREMP